MRAPNKERLLAALQHEKGDGIPNFEIVIGARAMSHILASHSGKKTEKSSWSADPQTAVEVCRRIGQDVVAVNISPAFPHASVLKKEDFAELKFPDVSIWKEKIKSYEDAVAGSNIGICARIGGPFTKTYVTTGPVAIQSFMLLLYDDPELIHTMMRKFTDYSIKKIKAIKNTRVDMFYIGDDLGSTRGPMFSNGVIAEFWAPYYHEIIEAMQAIGRPIINHCCGDQSQVLPYLSEWKVNATHPIQPVANDIYDIFKKYNNNLTLVGNIDISGPLSFGTKEETIAETREHLEKLAGNGGYVLCSSHSIIDSVVPENFLAMVNEGHNFSL